MKNTTGSSNIFVIASGKLSRRCQETSLFEDFRADTPWGRASCKQQLKSELAKLCREAIKEDLKERRAAVLTETAEAARRSFVNYETKMASLRRPYGTVAVSRRAMEKAIYDFHSDLFDSHEYKMPLRLTFIDLKKAFDSFKKEVITEALGNQGVPTQSTQ
uniref:Reverse transcriptase domain-containing protein n=1 Tax=Haemonchus placei TaxID=6290 RepID=A0A0N4VYF7_HAEPC